MNSCISSPPGGADRGFADVNTLRQPAGIFLTDSISLHPLTFDQALDAVAFKPQEQRSPVVRLQKPTTCGACFNGLNVGARVRRYGSTVYGMDCHDWGNKSHEEFEPSTVEPVFGREPSSYRRVR